MKDLLKSKKWCTMAMAIVATLLVNVLGIGQAAATEVSTAILMLAGVYVGGQSIADGLSGGATSSVE